MMRLRICGYVARERRSPPRAEAGVKFFGASNFQLAALTRAGQLCSLSVKYCTTVESSTLPPPPPQNATSVRSSSFYTVRLASIRYTRGTQTTRRARLSTTVAVTLDISLLCGEGSSNRLSEVLRVPSMLNAGRDSPSCTRTSTVQLPRCSARAQGQAA